jgi:hypothetical protein
MLSSPHSFQCLRHIALQSQSATGTHFLCFAKESKQRRYLYLHRLRRLDIEGFKNLRPPITASYQHQISIQQHHKYSAAMIGLGLKSPLKRAPREERDKQLHRLAHDEQGHSGAGRASGLLWGEGGFGEAKPPSCRAAARALKNTRHRRITH